MRILLVASDPMEFQGILAHATEVRVAAFPIDWARRAKLGEYEVVLAANGAGAGQAGAAVESALEHFAADCVISTGFCGALEPGMHISDVVVASAVVAGTRRFEALQPSTARVHHMGVVRSIGHVARTAAEKAELRATGACAVEMEAGGVADRAAVLGIPFYCIRVVSDLAGEDMANDFNRALRPDGHFGTMSILRGTLRNPWTRLPELIRFRYRCVRAARVLGEFIADCRF